MSNQVGDSADSGTAELRPGDARAHTRSCERRSAPRYPVDTRLFASIDGQTVRLHNLSEQGVAIQARGLHAGSMHLLEVNLDRQHVSVAVEVLACSDPNLLHARFVEPGSEARHLIAGYIRQLLALCR